MMRIGIVEDNLDFRDEVVFHLKTAGYAIAFESDGQQVDQVLTTTPCDVVILDLGLPYDDGLDLATHIQHNYPQIGVVMLTARAATKDRLIGLQRGADAYLAKPVDMRELILVLQNISRRLIQTSPPKTWVLDVNALKLQTPEGAMIVLSHGELKLIERMSQEQGTPVSRSDLAAAIGYTNFDYDYRRLEVKFSRLRQKLAQHAPEDGLFRSVRNKGYVLVEKIEISHGQ